MATYKVIQDIEAEDKFVGPLTLRQFIFAMFGALFAYLSFFMVSKGLTWGVVVTLPPMFFGFFMAIPWSSEQSTDVWVLAKIRFRMKPKKRIWDQSGQRELVTITAPKVDDKFVPSDISETEVKSRLKALAETLDSRGWVIKNAPLQPTDNSDSDRLIDISNMSQAVPDVDVNAMPDMLDDNKPGLENMIKQSGEARKEQIFEKMDRIRQGQTLEEAGRSETFVSPPAENDLDEEALSQTLKAKKQAGDLARGRMHTVSSQPSFSSNPAKPQIAITKDDTADNDDAAKPKKTGVEKLDASMTEQASPDILELSQNNDLNVATIARQANNKKNSDDSQEVVISLH